MSVTTRSVDAVRGIREPSSLPAAERTCRSELFVVVAVLRKFRARLNLDHRERQSLTVNGASEIPRREHLR